MVLRHHRRAAGPSRQGDRLPRHRSRLRLSRAYAYDNLETFSINVERILGEPGPVFTWLKVRPEIENQPIGNRTKWRKRSQVQVVADLKKELGIEI